MCDFCIRIRKWLALAAVMYVFASFGFWHIIQNRTIMGDPMKDFFLAIFMASLVVFCIYFPDIALFAKTLSRNALPAESSAPTAVKHYAPPYPNVWGYDLRKYPPMVGTFGNADFFRMPDGDIWILFKAEGKRTQVGLNGTSDVYDITHYGLLKFFSGELTFLTPKERDDFFDRKEYVTSVIAGGTLSDCKMNFKDGTQYRANFGFERYSEYPYVGGFISDFTFLEISKPDLKKTGSLPLYFLDKPKTLELMGDGELYNETFRLATFSGPFIPLQDDTFLAPVDGRILRLRRDFSTDFQGFEHYFVVLSRQRFGELLIQANKLHDDHFIENIVRDIQDHANQHIVKKS